MTPDRSAQPLAHSQGASRRGPLVAARAAGGLVVMLFAALLAGCGGSAEERAREHMDKAQSYLEASDLRAAVIELKNALQIDPDIAQARLMLGRAYLGMGAGPDAQKEFERAGEFGADAGEVEIGRAQALGLQGQYAEMLELVGKHAEEADAGRRQRWTLLRGEAQLGVGNAPGAIEAFEAAAKLAPSSAPARNGLVKAYAQANDLAGAKAALEAARDAGAVDGDTILLEGELAMREGRLDAAETAFRKSMESHPNNLPGRLGLARALLAQARDAEAAPLVDDVLAAVPGEPRALYLSAIIASRSKELGKARDALREVLSRLGQHPPSELLLGQVLYQLGELNQAQEMLRGYVARVPEDTRGHQLLARVLLDLDQPQAAIDMLQTAVAAAPGDAELLGVLALAHGRAGEGEKALAQLERAAALDPDAPALKAQLAVARLAAGQADEAVEGLSAAVASDPENARMEALLVVAKMRQGDTESAMAEAQELVASKPDVAWTHNLLGSVLESTGDREGAGASFARAVEAEPRKAAGTFNLARVLLAQGKRDEAAARYRAFLEHSPDHAGALTALAHVESAAGRSDEGLALLRRAASANAGAVEPRLVLANYALRTGDLAGARALVDEAVAVQPSTPAVRLLLARTFIAEQKPDDALPILRALLEVSPESVPVLLQLAAAETLAGNTGAARDALNSVLRADSANVAAKRGLAGIAISLGEYDEALKHADALIEAAPDQPLGHVIRGDTLWARDKPGEAVASYRRAQSIRPSSAVALKLHGTLRRSGDKAAARKLIEGWLADHPGDVVAQSAYASALLGEGEVAQATAVYEKLLELEPNNAPALNNLAWLYHQAGKADALALAERASTIAPRNPAIADTYGWLLVENRQVEKGLRHLRRAYEQANTNGDIAYHLAAATARAGDVGTAIDILAKALDGGPGFSEREQAVALLKELRSK